MPTAPQILPTQIAEGTAPGLTYRLEGELVPVLHMSLDGQVAIYFEHHVLLWKYPNMQIGLHPLKKGLKRRVFGGMPLLMLEAQSAGELAFSRDAPGHIVALHLPPGDGIVVREHQFLAATSGVEYDPSGSAGSVSPRVRRWTSGLQPAAAGDRGRAGARGLPVARRCCRSRRRQARAAGVPARRGGS
jgi:hypothetical protein